MEWNSIQEDEWRLCPDDSSPLVDLGYMSATPDVQGVSEFYCPRCDVAFLAILQLPSSNEASHLREPIAQVLRWSRVGSELEPDGEYLSGVFSERQWEVRAKNLRFHVRGFLQARRIEDPRGFPCPNDGSLGSVLGTLTDEGGNRFTLGWCRYCRVAVAHLHDEDYGWEEAAIFGWEEASSSFQLRDVLRRRGRAPVDDRSLIALASQIRPPVEQPG